MENRSATTPRNNAVLASFLNKLDHHASSSVSHSTAENSAKPLIDGGAFVRYDSDWIAPRRTPALPL